MATIAPHARVVHVTHAVPPGDVRRGAAVMAQVLPYLAPGVHLGVVDPGVGTARRGIAVVAGGGLLVGPDNGLLPGPARALGGVTAAYELADPSFWRPQVSRTFHGRDIFAPVTAHLAAGVDPRRLGPEVAAGDLVELAAPAVTVAPGRLEAEVVGVDHFGNVQLAAAATDLAQVGVAGERVTVTAGDARAEATVGTTFADVAPGLLVVIVDSAGYVAVAANGARAATALGVSEGATVTVSRAPGAQ
jgi:S-adenosylmethionine hydrolase